MAVARGEFLVPINLLGPTLGRRFNLSEWQNREQTPSQPLFWIPSVTSGHSNASTQNLLGSSAWWSLPDCPDLLSLPPLPTAPPPTLESISPSSLSLDADQLIDCSPALGLAPQDWVFDDSFISPLISELIFDPTESLDSASGNPSPPGSDSDMSALGLLGPSGRHNIMDPNEYFYQDQSVNSNFPHHHSQDSMSIQNMATTTGSPPSSHLFSLSTAPLSDSLSSNTPASYRPLGSPLSNLGSGSKTKKRAAESTPADLEAADDDAAVKRQRNTMAARKYRQKRLDRISDLERSLGDMTSERDQLKLQLARREAEVEALREMLGKK